MPTHSLAYTITHIRNASDGPTINKINLGLSLKLIMLNEKYLNKISTHIMCYFIATNRVVAYEQCRAQSISHAEKMFISCKS